MGQPSLTASFITAKVGFPVTATAGTRNFLASTLTLNMIHADSMSPDFPETGAEDHLYRGLTHPQV